MMNIKIKRGQVWVETMIYFLIGIAIMAAVLAFVRPKIIEFQDKAVIDQTRELMLDFDSKINAVYEGGQGNKRNAEVRIQRGTLTIHGESESISFVLDNSRVKYSQVDSWIKFGQLAVLTQQTAKDRYRVELLLNYSNNFELAHEGDENRVKSYAKATAPYKFSIEYNGTTGMPPRAIINIKAVG